MTVISEALKQQPDLEGSNSLSELGIVGLDGLPKFGPIPLASFDFLSRWEKKKHVGLMAYTVRMPGICIIVWGKPREPACGRLPKWHCRLYKIRLAVGTFSAVTTRSLLVDQEVPLVPFFKLSQLLGGQDVGEDWSSLRCFGPGHDMLFVYIVNSKYRSDQ